MIEKIRKCHRRVKGVLQFKLNAKNKLEAINTLASPAVTYSFNVVNWNLEEIKRIARKIGKLMTLNRMHHPKADVSRMYITRKEGGRGMTNLEMAYKTTTIGSKLLAVFRRLGVASCFTARKEEEIQW